MGAGEDWLYGTNGLRLVVGADWGDCGEVRRIGRIVRLALQVGTERAGHVLCP